MAGEPLFLAFLDTADNVAIGDGSTQFGKPLTFARLFKVLLNCLQMLLKSDDICSICEYIIKPVVSPNCIGFCRKV